MSNQNNFKKQLFSEEISICALLISHTLAMVMQDQIVHVKYASAFLYKKIH